jgi:hypothetical protein
MIAPGDPRFSRRNAAAPFCVDMTRRLVRVPRCASAMPGSAVRCGTLPAVLVVTDESPGKRGVGVRGFGCGRRKTPAWTGFVLTI